MKQKTRKLAKLVFVGLAGVLCAALFFVLLSTTVESVLRVVGLLVTLDFEEQNAGRELGEGIAFVLIIGLFSIIIAKQCWNAFRRGLGDELAEHPNE
ncbi:hypothetical protein QEH52_19515 [Coraliomargarita sp. SDUM461003]|uniref:Uncharacterized protein n=1 Tax=Thalassobacterium maritimum TaxID=3041265 RepID=A0ABU1AZY3_9BACT|nr:hypothetical protein [Coraliomargarita sp. SDUM461003]MDQ8209716.1 hypothetical protein [Coraliomargarita sp. SDUM461003]